ncbi:unnamed protein product, partial [Effrenium voratum]
QVLGFAPSEELSSRSFAELTQLIYRDDVYVKHSERPHLKREFQGALDAATTARPPKCTDVRAQMLVSHLLQIGCRGDDVVFAMSSMDGSVRMDDLTPASVKAGMDAWAKRAAPGRLRPADEGDDGLALARSPAPQQLQAASAAAGEKMAQELAWFKLVSDNLAKVTILGDQVQQELAKAVSLWGLLARALRDLLLQFTSSDISYFLLLILRDANS